MTPQCKPLRLIKDQTELGLHAPASWLLEPALKSPAWVSAAAPVLHRLLHHRRLPARTMTQRCKRRRSTLIRTAPATHAPRFSRTEPARRKSSTPASAAAPAPHRLRHRHRHHPHLLRHSRHHRLRALQWQQGGVRFLLLPRPQQERLCSGFLPDLRASRKKCLTGETWVSCSPHLHP